MYEHLKIQSDDKKYGLETLIEMRKRLDKIDVYTEVIKKFKVAQGTHWPFFSSIKLVRDPKGGKTRTKSAAARQALEHDHFQAVLFLLPHCGKQAAKNLTTGLQSGLLEKKLQSVNNPPIGK